MVMQTPASGEPQSSRARRRECRGQRSPETIMRVRNVEERADPTILARETSSRSIRPWVILPRGAA